jgi:hypothetical protein
MVLITSCSLSNKHLSLILSSLLWQVFSVEMCNQCLSSLTLWVRTPLRRGVLDTTLSDKVCQWLVSGHYKVTLLEHSIPTPDRQVKIIIIRLPCWNIVFPLLTDKSRSSLYVTLLEHSIPTPDKTSQDHH